LIGPGGKNIKRLVDESGCEIDIEDDGTVKIFSVSAEGMELAKKEIEALGAEIEVGKIYRGRSSPSRNSASSSKSCRDRTAWST
jgi:polyribonucleotide nucleotidyltransferase